MKDIKEIAYKERGFRERFAMAVGICKVEYWNGKPMYQWVYDSDINYQDANGRTFDPQKNKWVK